MANIEGRNPIIEALRSDRAIDKLMISNTSKEGSIKKIIGMAKEKNIVINYVFADESLAHFKNSLNSNNNKNIEKEIRAG